MAVHFTAHGRRLAAAGQAITVSIDADSRRLTLRAPFYRRSIPLADFTSASTHPDDSMNRGALNWYVTGRASSPAGVRLSTGGQGRVDIVTRQGRRFRVVVDTLEQARLIAHALDDARR